MSLPTDDGVVDPWVVLRRLMAENRALRAERDALHARVDELELRVLSQSRADVVIPAPTPDALPTEPAPAANPEPLPPPVSVPSPAREPEPPQAAVSEHPDIWSRLRPWQQDALTAWRDAGQRGVVEAVTGAGKTFVGVCAARDALAAGGRAVVVVPTIELQDQWWQVLAEQLPNADIGRLGGGRQDDLADCDVVVAIVHSAARRSMRPRPEDVLIADECHRYGAPSFALALEVGFDQRLGLTATFEREDDGITDHLRPYFGDVVFTLWYDRALADGVIAPFDIALVGVELTATEQRDYDACGERMDVAARNLEWRHNIAREPYNLFIGQVNRLAKDRGHPASQAARAYLGPMTARRALLAQSTGKLDVLAALEPAVRDAHGALVFTQTKESAETAAGMFEDVGIPASALYSGLDRDERRDRMDAFRERASHLLAAPRVLDEGVDVPEADLAVVVAGSRSRRQLVQRLGRVLRPKADGRAARLVMLYAKGTVEDPTLYDDSPLTSVLPHSRRQGSFALPADLAELLRFLLGDGPSAGDQPPAGPIGAGTGSRGEHTTPLERASLSAQAPVRNNEATPGQAQRGQHSHAGPGTSARAATPTTTGARKALAKKAPAKSAAAKKGTSRKPTISHSPSVGTDTALRERAVEGDDFDWDDEEESDALRQARKEAEIAASADSVRVYSKQIGRFALLTAEEEVDLAKRIEAGVLARARLDDGAASAQRLSPQLRRDLNWVVRDGARAKDQMIEANLRLVVSLARRYTGRGMAFLDLIQEGNLGLIRAVEKFDYTQGHKFSTYATWWIRQALSRGLADQARTIRIPVHMVEKLNATAGLIGSATDADRPLRSADDLAAATGVTLADARDFLRWYNQSASLDELLEEDAEYNWSRDFTVDNRQEHERFEWWLVARPALARLSDRGRRILEMRFGFRDREPMTLDEIGTEFGVTRERIRQLEKKALDQLAAWVDRDYAGLPSQQPIALPPPQPGLAGATQRAGRAARLTSPARWDLPYKSLVGAYSFDVQDGT